MDNIKGSYKENCIFLLKDLTGILKEITVEEKEKFIEQGISYSSFISREKSPSKEVKQLFFDIVEKKGKEIAQYVERISEIIYKEKGDDLVVVSLARAGTPYGILISKYIKLKYKVNIKHYSISIIRGKGIDFNALKYILDNNKLCKIQFVDGWTGKGSIMNQLNKSIKEFNRIYNTNIDSSLAVITDPAKLCRIYGTREDLLVPNSILNSTVSGLISRTVLNNDYLNKDDFHGAIVIDYLSNEDFSQYYVDKISGFFNEDTNYESSMNIEAIDEQYATKVVNLIKEKYLVTDINKIKLSIGEASRALIRRQPSLLLVNDINSEELRAIILMAKEKGVKIESFNESQYKAAAIIEEK